MNNYEGVVLIFVYILLNVVSIWFQWMMMRMMEKRKRFLERLCITLRV